MTSILTDEHLRAMHGEPGTPVLVSFDGSVASSTLSVGVTYLVQADQDCHIAVGASPTATTNSCPIYRKVPYLFTLSTATPQIAAISAGTAGTLSITPLTGYRV